MKYLNALNKINGLGPQKIKTLVNFFSNGEEIWQADFSELLAGGMTEKIARKIVSERKQIDVNNEWENLKRENIEIITFTDARYPQLLKEIPNPPYILYIKGYIDFNDKPMLAMVGARKFTSYGQQVASGLARELAQAGITVVSGMALGIDAISHRGALDGGEKTIAVLGSSLDDKNIGPRANFNLSREIIANGALVSDYPLTTPATANTFPARNRLMAGMSLGTIVIEADIKSGTLITANLALDFNRDIFAVPGSIFSPVSQGTNQLIKNGAKVITGVSDILEELDLAKKSAEKKIQQVIPDSKEEAIIYKILSADNEPLHIDRIIKLSKLETGTASATLSLLEMKGVIKNMGGQNYILS